jgi:LysR family transcriptional regulator (chromosome initiation inhibitor)
LILDKKQGEALLAVTETGSFEQAAARLHLTASAVSQRVRALEVQLGQPLVVRSRPCRPTRAGQRLLQYLVRASLLDAEFRAETAAEQAAPLPVAIAVNADSLATWFLPALGDFLNRERVLIDLIVDDQDHTYALLEAGLALGCVATEPQPLRGCVAEPLGTMRYRAMAAPAFRGRWFPQGMTPEAVRRAPVLVFNRKDRLQADFLKRTFRLLPGSYPCHYVPASDPFMQALLLGFGWGMLPDLQTGGQLAAGHLVELAPDHPIDVGLFWHSWKVQSPRLERLSQTVITAARRVLDQDPHPKHDSIN